MFSLKYSFLKSVVYSDPLALVLKTLPRVKLFIHTSLAQFPLEFGVCPTNAGSFPAQQFGIQTIPFLVAYFRRQSTRHAKINWSSSVWFTSNFQKNIPDQFIWKSSPEQSTKLRKTTAAEINIQTYLRCIFRREWFSCNNL